MDVHLFYNNSVHDGNGPAVTTVDFNAIATNKDPLQLGATVDFRNVSGYSRGINGLFIDIPDLPNDGAGIDASDLVLTVGNDSSPDTWASAPAPTQVGLFPNAGLGNADRIYVTFADGAIVDTWLGITILATSDMGLADPLTFFYGSVAGDTGAAFVGEGEFFGRDAADMQSIAADLFRKGTVTHPSDINRDGRVDAFDLQAIPVASGGGFTSNVLAAVTPEGGPPPLAAAAVDKTSAEDGPSAVEMIYPPGDESLGGPASPLDGRVGGKKTAERDLAFATFASREADLALPDGLFSALAAGKMAL